MTATITTTTDPITIAATAYRDLRDRHRNPAGDFDKQGRFYVTERCPACATIRRPSAAYPYSQMTHARSAAHVAAIHNVDPLAVKRSARAQDAAARLADLAPVA